MILKKEADAGDEKLPDSCWGFSFMTCWFILQLLENFPLCTFLLPPHGERNLVVTLAG